MKKLLVCLLFVSLHVLPGHLFAEQITENNQTTPCPEHSDTNVIDAPGNTWELFNRVKLELTDVLKSYKAKWQFEIAENRDLRISIDEQSGNDRRAGTIMLVSGLALLTNGLDLKEGYEIDSLNSPVLMCHLAISLLHYAFPDGPKSIGKNNAFEITEKNKPILVGTPNASSLFPPPWKLKGSVDKAEGGNVFDFSFSFKPNPASTEFSEIKFHGGWEKSGTTPQFPDAISLKGWKVFMLGSNEQNTEGDSIVGKGARSEKKSYDTLGDLRKSLALS